ncbi:MAG: killer suppression protein [Acidimicrobiia bacterium]|nr:killer suppression protein [Acidimicrobiia bacterium]MXX00406.1 killer suppression protein [Acidimicrobiia bacterium]MXX46062.1 killer suppression protein [Acidimicrobiia bacterium]MXY74180.1 killer suppression protein [Acidimicrobiia bacterium]MYA38308.1 killer suppression protein [Acidimicrobiia bacterium]
MQIRFANTKLRRLCEDEQAMRRKLGDRQARLLMRRLMEFRAAVTLSDIGRLPGARCHQLTGDRRGQLTVDLVYPDRLVFVPDHDPIPTKPDGGMDWSKVTAVLVIQIADTHS